LGVTIANISRVIKMEFVIILLIACVQGGLAGSFMAGMLMGSIWNYYLDATVLTLVGSAALMLFASFMSIVFKPIIQPG
jgi:hypothetical protein